jgi:thiol:disulfide interchange protein DsbD
VFAPLYAVQTFAIPAQTKLTSSDWKVFTPTAVTEARAAGKPVFVDFTASWCLSCQVNERVVLQRADVIQRLKDSGVVLMRADWTQRDETIAQTLTGLGRSGVPTYALYPASSEDAPNVLPEVLTPGILFNALDGLKLEKRASN